MRDYKHITVTPITGVLGAEISGVDLTQTVSDATQSEIRQAFSDHSVIVFRDQALSIEDQKRFTGMFGAFGFEPYVETMPDHPEVIEVLKEATEHGKNFGGSWHSDWSFQEAPPAATILHSEVTPPVGGDTLYADGTRAYADLSDEMKARLDGLMAIHSAILPYGSKGVFAEEKEKRTMEIISSTEAETTQLHPLVRTHPVTGKKALYISPTYTIGIEGMDDAEAQPLLGELYVHMVQDKYVYRHKWSQNMLTLWDNRCCLHLADGGYDGHLRVMHRTTIAGDVPA